MHILGLHGHFGESPVLGVHDAAYCLVNLNTGQIDALVESEKLTGKRHDGFLNSRLLAVELEKSGVEEVTIVTSHFASFADEPRRTFPLFQDIDSLNWGDIGPISRGRVLINDEWYDHYVYLHELAHIFTAFMFREREHERFLGWVIEGSGDFAQNALFLIDETNIQLLEYNLPILSGMFFNRFLAEKVFDAKRDDWAARHATPGKVMALAAYGNPYRFRTELERAINRQRAGIAINYRDSFCPELDSIPLSWKDRVDLSATAQTLFEDLICAQAVRIREQYGDIPVFFSGGCALSIKTNTKLRRLFSEITIPPNCGDDGQAMGLAALHAYKTHGIRLPSSTSRPQLKSQCDLRWEFRGSLSDQDIGRIVEWLVSGEVVAFLKGTPELGPRALGHRSILASPSNREMREVLNHMKNREYFRPVAPMVLDEFGSEFFEDYFYSPYMLFDFKVKETARDLIPAALHSDDTARIQSVREDQGDLVRLLKAYAERTGVPILLNTSFNSRGRAIAGTCAQIAEELRRLKIKYAVIGGQATEIRSYEAEIIQRTLCW